MTYAHNKRCQSKKSSIYINLGNANEFSVGTEDRYLVAWEGHEEGILKWCEETFGGDRYVLYLDCGVDSMGLFIGQNLSNCPP